MRSSLSTFPDAIRLRENDPQVGNLLCASVWRSVNAPDPLCAVARAPTSSSIPAGVQCERGTTTHTLRAAPTQLSSSRLITSTANCAHCYIRTRTRRRERHAVRPSPVLSRAVHALSARPITLRNVPRTRAVPCSAITVQAVANRIGSTLFWTSPDVRHLLWFLGHYHGSFVCSALLKATAVATEHEITNIWAC